MEKIFSDIKRTVDGAVKKSGELFELSKLKLAIGDTKNQIDLRFKELGKMVYEATKEEKQEDSTEQIFTDINQLYKTLSEQETRLDELKCVVTCPGCGKSCSDDSHYCSSCGAKIDE